MSYKFINTTILFLGLLVLLVLISIYFYIYKISLYKEGLTQQSQEDKIQGVSSYPKDSEINYNDINSPLYSHTVNLPINVPNSCKNFCGPKSQCAITREQCSSDIDCFGCSPKINQQKKQEKQNNILPYDAAGKLGQNQGLQYSPLTTGYNNHNIDFSEIYPGSKDAQLKKPYQGVDNW